MGREEAENSLIPSQGLNLKQELLQLSELAMAKIGLKPSQSLNKASLKCKIQTKSFITL